MQNQKIHFLQAGFKQKIFRRDYLIFRQEQGKSDIKCGDDCE